MSFACRWMWSLAIVALFFITSPSSAFTLSSGSSEGGEAGGGASDLAITTTTSKDKVQIIVRGVLPADTVTTIIILPSENMPIDKLTINPLVDISDIEITITKLNAGHTLISHELEGVVSDYISIGAPVYDLQLNNMTIGFKLPLSLINASNIDNESVVMSRYLDGKWNTLATTIGIEEGGFVYYSSLSPGFGVFGISGTTLSATDIETTTEQAITTKPTVHPKIASSGSTSPLVKMVFALLAIAAIAALLSFLEKKK